MGKTKAQRKKEYRERLKEKNNEKYQTEEELHFCEKYG